MLEYYSYFRFVSDEWRGVKVFSRFLDIVVLDKGDAETITAAVLNSTGSLELPHDTHIDEADEQLETLPKILALSNTVHLIYFASICLQGLVKMMT